MAATVPHEPALMVSAPRNRSGPAQRTRLTFRELEAQSNRYANGLGDQGIGRGTRVLLMVRPGLGFIGLVFALFKMGAVPILIDPGMGVRSMLACIRRSQPDGLIGIPAAHVMRVLHPAVFRSVRHVVTVGRRWFWGGPTLKEIDRCSEEEFSIVATQPDDTAAILFTSGSTGPAKGVVYQHRMFDAQVRAIRDHYRIEPGEVDLPTFPLFALFNPALGVASVIPDMDPAHPARADPAHIVEAIRRHRVTSSFGSPALWNRVSAFCAPRDRRLASIRRVLIAGAPVPWTLVQRMKSVLPAEAEVHTPYGATEALPVASIGGQELIPACAERTRVGAGICVGRPLPGVSLRVIRVTDEPLQDWSDAEVLPVGEIGEFAVQGEVVTRCYDSLPHATALSKIREETSSAHSTNAGCWHRMGDVGYYDTDGRLWFCGRKAHRVVTEQGVMFTIPCEAIFNEHPDVARSALVGIGPSGSQSPVMVIEPRRAACPRGRAAHQLRIELLEWARRNPLTARIKDLLFHRSFPVDVRHNAKINREALAKWAARRLK